MAKGKKNIKKLLEKNAVPSFLNATATVVGVAGSAYVSNKMLGKHYPQYHGFAFSALGLAGTLAGMVIEQPLLTSLSLGVAGYGGLRVVTDHLLSNEATTGFGVRTAAQGPGVPSTLGSAWQQYAFQGVGASPSLQSPALLSGTGAGVGQMPETVDNKALL